MGDIIRVDFEKQINKTKVDAETQQMKDELKATEDELKQCLNDLENLNEMVVELTALYESQLDLLCEKLGVKLPTNDN